MYLQDLQLNWMGMSECCPSHKQFTQICLNAVWQCSRLLILSQSVTNISFGFGYKAAEIVSFCFCFVFLRGLCLKMIIVLLYVIWCERCLIQVLLTRAKLKIPLYTTPFFSSVCFFTATCPGLPYSVRLWRRRSLWGMLTPQTERD